MPRVHNQYLLITAILTNICNLLVIYGLANQKMLYLNIGAFQHAIASLYFAITGLYYCAISLLKEISFAELGPTIMVLIVLEYWFVFAMENIQKHVDNMENDPKSMSDTQIV